MEISKKVSTPDFAKDLFGSPGWIRTNNLAVNSRPLYH